MVVAFMRQKIAYVFLTCKVCEFPRALSVSGKGALRGLPAEEVRLAEGAGTPLSNGECQDPRIGRAVERKWRHEVCLHLRVVMFQLCAAQGGGTIDWHVSKLAPPVSRRRRVLEGYRGNVVLIITCDGAPFLS